MGSCFLFGLKETVQWVCASTPAGCIAPEALNRAGLVLVGIAFGCVPLPCVYRPLLFLHNHGARVEPPCPGMLWARDRSLGQGASI
jgi:hypothetical protein